MALWPHFSLQLLATQAVASVTADVHDSDVTNNFKRVAIGQ